MLNGIQNRKIANDKIWTPKSVVLEMIKMCDIKETDKVLDPCYGEGIFYNNLPICKKSFCEIDKGKDFFEFKEHQDLIIGNPPFSLWSKWIKHTMTLTNKFCYIMNGINITLSRIKFLNEGGFHITEMKILNIPWWFGDQFILICEKTDKKNSILDFIPEKIKCDICNGKCKRGLKTKHKKYGMNECSILKKNKQE